MRTTPSARRDLGTATMFLLGTATASAWVASDEGLGPGTIAVALLGLAASAVALLGALRTAQPIWAVFAMREDAEALADGPLGCTDPALALAAEGLVSAASRLRDRFAPSRAEDSALLDSQGPSRSRPLTVPALTRSALFDPVSKGDDPSDPMASREFSSVLDVFAKLDMIARLEPETLRWIDSSPAEQAFLGRSLNQLRRMSYLDVVHPDDRELAGEELRASVPRGEAHGLIYRVRTASGETKAVEINVGVRYAQDATVDHLRCHITDVTGRLRADRDLRRRTKALLVANRALMKANRELQEMKDLYGDLYQNAPAMYFSLDPTGAIVEVNNTLLKALGYPRERLIGRPYLEILPEWRRAAFVPNFEKFLQTGTIAVESRWVKADGEMIDVFVTGTAIRDANGAILRSRSVAQDVTARKALEAQLQDRNASLARANEVLERKNQELDEFSHVVSHDLFEPLRTMGFFSGQLQKDQGDRLGAEGLESVARIVDAADRMRGLIRDLLELSRAGRATREFAPVNLDEVAARVRADLAALIAAKGGDLVVRQPLPTAWGDRGRIAQLLTNLVSNGLKYHGGQGRPTVELAAWAEEGGAVTISVRDNGIGIDPKHHERIFQIFRRLHAQGEYEGNGAGLAICQKIARAHGGTIRVESTLGQGATFFVHLPGPGDS